MPHAADVQECVLPERVAQEGQALPDVHCGEPGKSGDDVGEEHVLVGSLFQEREDGLVHGVYLVGHFDLFS